MSLWLVRAGSYGEQEQGALENSAATIGWNELGDLSNIKSRTQLEELFTKVNPDATKNSIANQVGQIWRFIHEIQKGDLVALPLKTQSAIAVGQVEGDYEYKELTGNIKTLQACKVVENNS